MHLIQSIIKRLDQQRYARKMQRENNSGQRIHLRRDLRIQGLGKCHGSEVLLVRIHGQFHSTSTLNFLLIALISFMNISKSSSSPPICHCHGVAHRKSQGKSLVYTTSSLLAFLHPSLSLFSAFSPFLQCSTLVSC